MKWTKTAWKTIEEEYQQIKTMAFIEELSNGTLPLHKFQFYMTQDAHYLEHFAKSLALIGSRSLSTTHSLAFIRFAEGAIVVEKALHDSYFKQFGIDTRGAIAPTTHHYIHFLKATASLANVSTAMAAVLPCFWIYNEIGDFIYQQQKHIKEQNPYANWIETYSGEEFTKLVNQAIAICDDIAESCTEAQQKEMTKAFIDATKLEYLFWKQAYTLQSW